MAISYHFQTLTYQALPGTMLEYVGFCWAIFGYDGYNLVTVRVGRWGPSQRPPLLHKKDPVSPMNQNTLGIIH